MKVNIANMKPNTIIEVWANKITFRRENRSDINPEYKEKSQIGTPLANPAIPNITGEPVSSNKR